MEVNCIPALKPLNDLVNEGTYVLASNAGMKVGHNNRRLLGHKIRSLSLNRLIGIRLLCVNVSQFNHFLQILEARPHIRTILVGIPQEVVVYGLFVNKDMFDEYGLELPNTPEELLECCRVFKENGIETPVF